jgi:hypothetical protein
MARTSITPTVPPGKYPVVPLTAGAAALPLVAADTVNFNSTPSTGREVLIVQNNAGAPATVTINSSVDPQNRTGDITAYSIPANSFAAFGPFPVQGWRQPDGTLWFQGSAATVLFGVLQLPPLS